MNESSATNYAVVRLSSTVTHAVPAIGTAADGSLHGFYTLCGREIVFGNYAELEGREFDCRVCQRAASSIARCNRSTDALKLLRALLPMLERKGAPNGPGVCVHDIWDQERYRHIYQRACVILEVAP